MLIELAIGDAFGRPFEFASQDFIKKCLNRKFQYVNRESEKGRKRIGRFTDDTQMTLAIAEHMVYDQPMTQKDYVFNFVSAYRRDPRNGYSRRVKSLLENSKSVNVFLLDAVKPLPRNSNGSVMRTLPIGLYHDVDRVKQAAIIQTTTTHQSLECLNATVTLAVAVHYFYHEIDALERLPNYLTEQVGDDNSTRAASSWKGGSVPCDAWQTVSFCLKNVQENTNYSDILYKSIEVGGDVDSLAAISLGLASIMKGKVNDLPDTLFANLENGPYGRDYISVLDQQLLSKFPKKNKVAQGSLF